MKCHLQASDSVPNQFVIQLRQVCISNPLAIKFKPNRTIVLIDWASVTTDSLQFQLIDLPTPLTSKINID